jgi:hypothetical protein
MERHAAHEIQRHCAMQRRESWRDYLPAVWRGNTKLA